MPFQPVLTRYACAPAACIRFPALLRTESGAATGMPRRSKREGGRRFGDATLSTGQFGGEAERK